MQQYCAPGVPPLPAQRETATRCLEKKISLSWV
jgi:hypothetical protein